MRFTRSVPPATALLFALLLLCWWLLPARETAQASPTGATDLVFSRADMVFAGAGQPPVDSWQNHAIPSRRLLTLDHAPRRADDTIWLRLSFDDAHFANRSIALFAGAIEQNYAVILNGHEVYRSSTGPNERSFAWNGPLFVQLPAGLLVAGANTVQLRVTTSRPQPLVVGELVIGTTDRMRARYDRANFLSLIAPQIITGYLLIMTIGICTLWIKRPRESLFGWLALVGVVWIFRNLHFFIQTPPFDPHQFWSLTIDSVFVLLAAALAFGIRFFELARPQRLTGLVFAICLAEIGLRRLLVSLAYSELPVFLLLLPLIACFTALFARACIHGQVSGRWLVFGAFALANAFAFHDVARSVDAWTGMGLSLHPYGGLLLFSAFDIVLTRRLQNALADVEDVNERLDARVVAVTDELKASEASRARLQVSMAVGQERDRIMQEIHDGIGSNLVTALALAQRQDSSGNAVTVLRRSITDLKIAVDSLEPVEGDLILLLASLRHRLEGELLAAGVATVWKVEPCPPLSWLNPVNALHVLRIIQEAIGNVLLHAGASTITVVCAPQRVGGTDGFLVSVVDDGSGPLHKPHSGPGRGLRNMQARAEALGGTHHFEADVTGGSRSTLWIPQ